jgi:type III secretion system SsaH family protein
MMSAVESEIRRLIVEAGLVAVNHGFMGEAHAIREALPDLVAAPRLRDLIDAVMLIGLGEREEAARLLNGDASDEAETLRMLLKPEYSKPARFPPARFPSALLKSRT